MPGDLFATPVPWVKLAYGSALVLAAGWCAARLATPTGRVGPPTAAIAAAIGAMVAVGVLDWSATPVPQRMPRFLSGSWASCPWNVLALSVPALAATLWALKGLAPTRPRAAGCAAGLAAGAAGTLGYAVSCAEPAMSFVAAWYTAAIALAGIVGALIGPELLEW